MWNLERLFSFVPYFSLAPSPFAALCILCNGQRTVDSSCHRFVVYIFCFCGILHSSRPWKESHLPFFIFLMNIQPHKRAARNAHYNFPNSAFPLILDIQGEPTGLCWSILHLFRQVFRKKGLLSSWCLFTRTAAYFILK